MRIAVILETPLHLGGGFQQELSLAVMLSKESGRDEFVFYSTRKENIAVLASSGVRASFLPVSSLLHKIHNKVLLSTVGYPVLAVLGLGQGALEKILTRQNIDLVFFLSPSWKALALRRLNYIIHVWDQCHRDWPEFPEVRFDGEFENREFFFRKGLLKAVAVLVDAPYSKAALVRRYGCDEDRVFVFPFLPAVHAPVKNKTDIRAKYRIANKFVFYPAQFWPHKNHVYLLDGLKILRDKYGVVLDAVFSGSDKGALSQVLSYARQIGLDQAVHYVGFIPGEEVDAFYKEAVALVMPTYFGPTNMPPLEALVRGCPVCYFDLPGPREQLGEGGFFMDLSDPHSMAEQIMMILNQPRLVRERLNKGRLIVESMGQGKHMAILQDIFQGFRIRMKCWKPGSDC